MRHNLLIIYIYINLNILKKYYLLGIDKWHFGVLSLLCNFFPLEGSYG